MRFSEYFTHRRAPVISFEVFPPKTAAAMAQLEAVLPELIALRPSYVTVTYGALGSTRERTLEIASLVKAKYGLESACHLTCVGSSRAEIDRMLNDIRRAGIENIVALRGDPPRGETEFVPAPDGYAHANELVEHIRRFRPETLRRQAGSPAAHEFTGFGVAVAGYPEKHVEAPSRAADLAHLKHKVDAGADLVITQLFYDNACFFRFVREARALGIEQPIVPGLLPILSVNQIRRITSLCGATIPDGLQAELEAAGDDDQKAEDVGVRHSVAQAAELLESGAPGVHFYVLNKSRHLVRIMEQLRPLTADRRASADPPAG